VVQADLAGREFEGEKGSKAVIIGAAQVVENPLSEEERAAVLARHADAMNIPRRPAWDHQTTGQQVQDQERAAFLEWRRKLARCALFFSCWLLCCTVR
jgi:large subunit GTPase 1